MRERMQGIIAIAIVAIICVTFALWGIQYYLREHGGTDVTAKVDGFKITRQQLEMAYNREKRAHPVTKDQVLSQLITDEVLFQGADRAGFRVGSQQVNAVLSGLPVFQENGHFSATRFQQVLSGMLYSAPEFIDNLRKKMVVNQFQTGILASTVAFPNEINKFVGLIKQTRDIGYVIIPIGHFTNQIKPSAQDIKNYYSSHQDQFTTKEQISISYLELSADKLKTAVKVTPADLRQFYDDNIDLYSTPEEWQVVRAFAALPENADASVRQKAKSQVVALAKQNKFDKPIWIMRGQASQLFIDELQKLKPGQLSNPIEAPQGFYILKLLQSKKAAVKPFAAVADQVKKALMQKNTEKLFAEQSNQLSDLTYSNSNSLNAAAKALNLTVQSTGFFTKQGDNKGILANPKIIQAAFSDEVLTQNYNSDPIEINPGQIIVLRIKQHKTASVKPLAAVQQIIKQQVITEQASKKAAALGGQLLTAIKDGKSGQKFTMQYGLTWHKLTRISRDQKNINPQILQAAFTAELNGINLTDGDYAVVQVTKIYPGSVKQLSVSELAQLKTAIAQNFGRSDYELYVDGLKQKANIKKYDL